MSKAKRKAKRLQVCSQCGMRNIASLKSHKCKKAKRVQVEIVPAPDKKALAECAVQICRVHEVIEKKTRQFQEEVIYDLVELGLYFLKAKKAIGHGNFEQFVESGAAQLGTPLIESFAKSATVADLKNDTVSFFPRTTLRTAQRYMNAARNAGLDENSTTKDVDKLRASEALHGRKPTDLYRLMDANEEEGEEDSDSGTKWNLIRDAAVNLREHCDTVVELKPQMNKKVFSTVCARLQHTLEELTGHPWDMIAKEFAEHSRAKFKEHGDVYEIGQ